MKDNRSINALLFLATATATKPDDNTTTGATLSREASFDSTASTAS